MMLAGSLFYASRAGVSFNEGCRRWPLTLLPVFAVLREPWGLFVYVSLWRPFAGRWRWSNGR